MAGPNWTIISRESSGAERASERAFHHANQPTNYSETDLVLTMRLSYDCSLQLAAWRYKENLLFLLTLLSVRNCHATMFISTSNRPHEDSIFLTIGPCQ